MRQDLRKCMRVQECVQEGLHKLRREHKSANVCMNDAAWVGEGARG